jgi:hypothetical protein
MSVTEALRTVRPCKPFVRIAALLSFQKLISHQYLEPTKHRSDTPANKHPGKKRKRAHRRKVSEWQQNTEAGTRVVRKVKGGHEI